MMVRLVDYRVYLSTPHKWPQGYSIALVNIYFRNYYWYITTGWMVLYTSMILHDDPVIC